MTCPASELVLARTALAAAMLLPVAVARGALTPVLRRWRPLLAFAMFEIAIPWVSLGRAEQRLPSSTTGLLIAAVPLVGVAVAFLGGRAEPLSRIAWGGLGLGILGVAALVGLDVSGSDLSAVALLGITVVGYAIGPAIMSRYLGGLPGVGVVASALTVTALLYVPIVLVGDGVPTGLPSRRGDLVRHPAGHGVHGGRVPDALRPGRGDRARSGPPPSPTSTRPSPWSPVRSMLSEPVTVWTVVGFVLVVAGSYFVNRRPRVARRAEPAAGALEVEPVTT